MLVGKGSGGSVYDIEDGLVAKIIRKSCNPLELFILKYLKHPNIMSCDAIEYSEGVFRIIQKKALCNLSEYLQKNKRLSKKIRLNFCSQILSAVDYLHSYGILHCDIKPHNILVFENNIVKLCDFGLARFECFQPTSTKKLYTYIYKPPEVFNGGFVSFHSDLWSLGCTFYEIFYGVPYFTRINDELFHVETILKKDSEFDKLITKIIKERCSLDEIYKNSLIRKNIDKEKHIQNLNLLLEKYEIKDKDLFLNKIFNITKYDDCSKEHDKIILENDYNIYNYIL